MIADITPATARSQIDQDEQCITSAGGHRPLQYYSGASREHGCGCSARRGHRRKTPDDEALYSNVQPTLVESVKLIYDFRQNPKKYLPQVPAVLKIDYS